MRSIRDISRRTIPTRSFSATRTCTRPTLQNSCDAVELSGDSITRDRAETLRVGHLHTTELGLPAVDAVLGHAVSPGPIRRRGTCLVLLQDRNNLLLGIALALHVGNSHVPHGPNYGGTVKLITQFDTATQLVCWPSQEYRVFLGARTEHVVSLRCLRAVKLKVAAIYRARQRAGICFLREAMDDSPKAANL